MSKRRPQYHRGARTNAGIMLPHVLLHSVLADLPRRLGRGEYANDAREEILFSGISDTLMDSCFHALQHRPPAIALQFPAERSQLPMITLVRESMTEGAQIMGHDAGPVDDEYVVTSDIELTPAGGAVGGETTFHLPAPGGALVHNTTECTLTRAGETFELGEEWADFAIDADKKVLTIAPLIAGDVLRLTRCASYGLVGGDLHTTVFDFSVTCFVDTENPLLTSVLEGIVWREFILHHDELIRYGLVDLDFGMRALSQWQDVVPAVGYRSELVVTGKVMWIAFEPILDSPKTMQTSVSGQVLGDTDTTDDLLVMTTDLVVWQTEDQEETGEG